MSTQEEILIKQQSECMAKQAMQIEVLTELLEGATRRASMNLDSSRKWKEKYEQLEAKVKYCKEQL
jgi:hypothetical protein